MSCALPNAAHRTLWRWDDGGNEGHRPFTSPDRVGAVVRGESLVGTRSPTLEWVRVELTDNADHVCWSWSR